MTKAILSLILSSMLVVSVLGTASSGSATAGSFNQSALTKVFDSANSTAGTTYTQYDTATGYIASTSVYGPSITFGAGTTNDTIYCWGLKLSSALALTGGVKRTINATTAALGTDTTEQSITTADTTFSITSVTLNAVPVVAAGGGYLAFSAVVTASSVDTLYLYIVSGTTATAYTVSAATAATWTSSAAGNIYTYAVNAIWYEDSTFYVLYEALTIAVAANDASSTSVTTTGIYLQGFSASAGAKLWSSGAATIASSLSLAGSVTSSTTTYAPNSMAMGGGSNYTGSTSILVVYKDTTTTTKYVSITKSSGTVGTANTIGTDVSGTSFFAPAGVIGSNYTYGVAMGVGTSSSAFTNVTGLLNGSTTAGGSNLYYTALSTTAAPMVMGYRYSSGYATIVKYLSSTSTYSYSLYISYANATLNTTAISTQPAAVATVYGATSTSSFVDVNGALWFGYTTFDTSTNAPATGYIGKLLSQVNQNFNTASTSGSILTVFSALVSFVIISLFMF